MEPNEDKFQNKCALENKVLYTQFKDCMNILNFFKRIKEDKIKIPFKGNRDLENTKTKRKCVDMKMYLIIMDPP